MGVSFIIMVMALVNNLMSNNQARVLGNDIYNNGTHASFNLTFINNYTVIIGKNKTVTL